METPCVASWNHLYRREKNVFEFVQQISLLQWNEWCNINKAWYDGRWGSLNFIWPPAVGFTGENDFQSTRSNLVFVVRIYSTNSVFDPARFHVVFFSETPVRHVKVGETTFWSRQLYIYKKESISFGTANLATAAETSLSLNSPQDALCEIQLLCKHSVSQVIKEQWHILSTFGARPLAECGLFP